jgi:subtilase family protein
MSGTSMATPEVSGAAALVLAQDASLTPTAVRQRLMDSVDKLQRLTNAVGSGGRLDVAKALGVTALQPTTPPAGTTNSSTGTTVSEPSGPTVTVAAPRAGEPAAPAQTCPTAPVRTPTASGPTTPLPPVTPAPTTTPQPAPVATPPATTTTPPATTAPVTRVGDRTSPTVGLSFSSRGALTALLKSRLRVSTTVSERASVKVEIRLDARTAKKLHIKAGRSGVRIATGSASAGGAGSSTVTLKLTSTAKRALARIRSVKATVKATATDAAGNHGTRSRTLTIRR